MAPVQLKGAVLAQKALQRSKMETEFLTKFLEKMKKKVVYNIVSYILSHTPRFSKNLSAKYSLIHIETYIFLM